MFNKFDFLSFFSPLIHSIFVVSKENSVLQNVTKPRKLKRTNNTSASMIKNLLPYRIIILVAALLCYTQATQAQGWEYTFGGNAEDFGTAVLQTADEGFVQVGYSQSFGDNGDYDIYVVRLDVDGTEVWTNYYDEEFIEYAYAAIETPDNSILIAGAVQDRFSTTTNAYLMKIGPDGVLEWTKQYGGDKDDAIYDIIEAQDGGYLMVGRTRSYSSESNENTDIYVVKIDENGNEEWARGYGTTDKESARAVAQVEGGYVIAGATKTSSTQQDAYLLQIDIEGNMDWSKTYGSFISYEDAIDVAVLSNGDIVLAGTKDLQDFYLLRLDSNGIEIWENTYGNVQEDVCSAMVLDAEENILLAGATSAEGGLDIDVLMIKVDGSGNELWTKQFGKTGKLEEPYSVVPTMDGGYILSGYQSLDDFALVLEMYLVKTNSAGDTYTNNIQGQVYYDQDRDCIYDGDDVLLDEWLVKIEGEDRTFYGVTDAEGNYQVSVDTGAYHITILPQDEDFWMPCWDDQNRAFQAVYDTLSGVDFPIQAKVNCPYLKVDISSGLFNCDALTYNIAYCNRGTNVAEDAYVIIDLDDKLDYAGASIPLTASSGNLYRFELGNLAVGECGNFEINTPAIEDCNLYVTGSAYQVGAKIYPDSLCTVPDTDWNRASVRAKGECDALTNEVKFTIENVGGGDMDNAEQFTVIQQDIIMFQSDYQLPIGQSKRQNFTADGSTYRIIVYQPDGHPGTNYATVAVEGCGTDNDGNYAVGSVTQFPEADQEASVAKDVQESVEDTDGTILRGFPKGYGGEHFIETETDLTYHIQFQNVGQRNVKRVVIRDTLSSHLDVTSIIPGASSHPYTYEVYGEGILKFTFENIDLPSSNMDAAGSKGFVKFRVSQQPNISRNTVITNNAVVYMGYQKPITSNEVFHTVGGELEEFVTIMLTDTDNILQEGVSVQVTPNPFEDFTTIEVQGVEASKLLSFTLYDVAGKAIRQEQFTKDRFTFYRNALAGGMYFYQIQAEGRLLNAGKVMVK